MINVLKIDNAATIDLTQSIQFVPSQIEKGLGLAGYSIVRQVIDRIQNRGESTGGLKLDTYALERDGRYSAPYGRKRRALGLRTDLVNLTVTGDLVNDYKVLDNSYELVTVGFGENDTADIAEYQEAYYGDEIFDPSDIEIDEAINELEGYILTILP
ncbi:hypothetical protein SAMN04515674_105327 [Pseudarcicella hirudinis]|uniref:Uncharacterized protein n=1 Tax=Pseudarcicella hirudinis TaxID=1079859 RepID=A0A1I5T1N5_9BACT|nr:hypothetical protein [Pseudarcicella hirudinis]SFP76940.1 hypothetical protein SAMN04515674_105327 [Pseudarcicella hirudinis]